jgi:hypothetical protein
LHAATVCEAWQRSRLERLWRCITRPPIATKCIGFDDRSRVVYRYKHLFRDRSTHVVLEPLDFIARLAALAQRALFERETRDGQASLHSRQGDGYLPKPA